MSANTSCSRRAAELLEKVRAGLWMTPDFVTAVGEECPSEFFRMVVEPLADSFDPTDVLAYEQMMSAWLPFRKRVQAVIPDRVETVYVLSRVTLGADIKITSVVLEAMRRRFPDARIVLVSNRKCAELFLGNARFEHLEANYPRSGPVSARVAFAAELRERLNTPNRIVVDPDSRMTQLGLVPVAEPERTFHFPSRDIGGEQGGDLTFLTNVWLQKTFGIAGRAWIAPVEQHAFEADGPVAAVSFGVGENDSKLVGGQFEAMAISLLGHNCATIWVDRGAGGSEAERVTKAVEDSGAASLVRFWEGSFAGFASIIAQSHLYLGYDSAGQHAAAALDVPLISVFAGAANDRFRQRWQPAGMGPVQVVNADGLTPNDAIEAVARILESWTSRS